MAMLNNQRVHVKAWNKGRMHKIFIPVWHVAKENRRYQISQEKTSHYTLHPQFYAIQVSAGRIHWLVEPFDSSVWIQNLQGQASFLACLKIGWLPKFWCLTTSFFPSHWKNWGSLYFILRQTQLISVKKNSVITSYTAWFSERDSPLILIILNIVGIIPNLSSVNHRLSVIPLRSQSFHG
jgi:hypothetical protein